MGQLTHLMTGSRPTTEQQARCAALSAQSLIIHRAAVSRRSGTVPVYRTVPSDWLKGCKP